MRVYIYIYMRIYIYIYIYMSAQRRVCSSLSVWSDLARTQRRLRRAGHPSPENPWPLNSPKLSSHNPLTPNLAAINPEPETGLRAGLSIGAGRVQTCTGLALSAWAWNAWERRRVRQGLARAAAARVITCARLAFGEWVRNAGEGHRVRRGLVTPHSTCTLYLNPIPQTPGPSSIKAW